MKPQSDFEAIYRANASSIADYFARRGLDAQSVADLTSETFVEALGSLASFDPARGKPRSWLFGIARVVLAHHWERTYRGRDLVSRIGPRLALDQEDLEELAERIDAQREGRRLLERCHHLPDLEREAIELVDLIGMSPKEAAASLGVSAGVLRVRLFRARNQLRKEHQ